MTMTKPNDAIAEAFKQAQAQFNSIAEYVEALRAAEADDSMNQDAIEDARRAIEEDALSVEVRSGWYCPGTTGEDRDNPEEYKILLCTGGPAVQIVGKLDQWMQPETATLQAQDWFTPWTDYQPSTETMTRTDAEAVLLAYARVFYFGG